MSALRAVAMYLKVVDGGNHQVPKAREGGEHERCIIPSSSWGGGGVGVSPKKFFLILSASMLILMGFLQHVSLTHVSVGFWQSAFSTDTWVVL